MNMHREMDKLVYMERGIKNYIYRNINIDGKKDTLFPRNYNYPVSLNY